MCGPWASERLTGPREDGVVGARLGGCKQAMIYSTTFDSVLCSAVKSSKAPVEVMEYAGIKACMESVEHALQREHTAGSGEVYDIVEDDDVAQGNGEEDDASVYVSTLTSWSSGVGRSVYVSTLKSGVDRNQMVRHHTQHLITSVNCFPTLFLH